jgi:predicted dehydrogenase
MSSNEIRSTVAPVRWGILGAARIAAGKTIPGMVASAWCQPQAIGARDLGRAQSLARQFGIPSAYGSYEQVLNDPAVEAVYIALPNHLHVQWALAAADKGKHVLCEKPIAMTAEEAAILARSPRTIKIAEAFMVRQQPRWAKLREILGSGRYGAPLTAQMLLSFFMSNPNDFRNKPEFGGGAVYDLGCYTTMTARYVFEAEPKRVVAVAELDKNGVDTTTTAILDFGVGRHAAFTVSIAMASSQTLHVVCERGFLDLPKPYVPARDEPSHLHADISASHDLSDVTTTSFEALDQYETEVTEFSKALRGKAVPFFGIEDAIANMRVIDAIFASIKSGQWEDMRRP